MLCGLNVADMSIHTLIYICVVSVSEGDSDFKHVTEKWNRPIAAKGPEMEPQVAEETWEIENKIKWGCLSWFLQHISHFSNPSTKTSKARVV